jgi:hypothetical protein
MFKFYFLPAHKPTPRQVASVVLSALKIIFHNNSRPVGSLPTHKRSAYSSNISEEQRRIAYFNNIKQADDILNLMRIKKHSAAHFACVRKVVVEEVHVCNMKQNLFF